MVDRHDLFGWSLWIDLFTGNRDWITSLDLDQDTFDPEEDGWVQIFDCLKNTLTEAGLLEKFGACYHVSSSIPELSMNPDFNIDAAFKAARDAFMRDVDFEFGMHSTFGLQDLPLSGNYPRVLAKDIKFAEYLGATCIVEHPPKCTGNCVSDLVDELTSSDVINSLKRTRVELHWENMGPNVFFGSLKNLIYFREQLSDRLQEIGEKGLIKQHLFNLDTGHLLIWRDGDAIGREAAQREIEEFLPEFAKNLRSFHIHANDGTSDNHIVPFSNEFFDHPTRKTIDFKVFSKNSNDVMEFLKTCNENKRIVRRHVHIEALKLPFSLQQIIEFGRRCIDAFGF